MKGSTFCTVLSVLILQSVRPEISALEPPLPSAASQCGGNIVAEEGVIKSPSYPNNYGSNDVCTWKITIPEDHSVLIKFEAFEVEDSPGCGNDYVEFLDGHETTSIILERFCGYYIPDEFRSSGHKITVRFVSDDAREYSGFLITFEKAEVYIHLVPPQVAGMSACERAIDYEKGTVVSPHYPQDYEPNDECTWTIIGPPGSKISLSFKTFQVEGYGKCSSDHVSVHDGSDVSHSPLLGRFCGNEIPNLITSSGNQMTVHFESDYGGYHRGFAAIFNSSKGLTTASKELQKEDILEEHIFSDEGIVQSPNYPENYGPDLKSFWKITVSSGHQVVLKFNDFKVETHTDCVYDYVLVRDGHSIRSRVLNKLCGYEIPNEIRSTGNTLMIEFKSDPSVEYSGFSAEFKKDLPAVPNCIPSQALGTYPLLPECKCGIVANAVEGTIESPNFPLPYGPLEECVWTYTVPEGDLITIKFELVNLEYGKYCEFDQLTVLDGGNADSPVLKTMCYETRGPRILTSTNKITVTLTSDDSFEGPGFASTFGRVHICGENITANKGVLQSPNITGVMGYQCIWRITVPIDNTVLLKVHGDWDVDYYSEDFYLKIHDGSNIYSPILKEPYNLGIPNVFSSTGNEMLVIVASFGSDKLRYFNAEFQMGPT